MDYNVAVIGAGPGGYVAAIRSAHAGLKTALIECDLVGGTCLNRGCIPTKNFASVAEKIGELGGLGELGIEGVTVSGARVNLAKIVERKNHVVAGLRAGILQLFKANKIELHGGRASFVSANEINIDGANKTISADNIIIATGSAWQAIPNLVPDGKKILTSDHMLDLQDVPKKFLIVGGGVIGCEFASIMNAFGSDVTIVELMEQILPSESAFIARMLSQSFKKRGIKILNGVTVSSVEGNIAVLSSGEKIEADQILVSIGRKPYTQGLNLEKVSVKTERGFIATDLYMRTSVPNIYAIGDVSIPSHLVTQSPNPPSSKPMLAHVAYHDAAVAVENIVSYGSRKADYSVVPRPIFTSPEIGCVGLTEKQLNSAKVEYKIGRYAYSALSKAVCDGAMEGALQVYVANDKKILGAHCIGAHATDICSELSVSMQNGLTADRVAQTIHAHPTYSEIIVEALEDATGHAVHKVKK